MKRGLSAGRVQSVALRLICDREAEIDAFEPREYWSITAEFSTTQNGKPEPTFEAKLHRIDGEKVELPDEASARSILRRLEGAEYTVVGSQSEGAAAKPSAPIYHQHPSTGGVSAARDSLRSER